MTHPASPLSHAQSGPVDVTALALVGVFIAAAAFWLVAINRRLDAKEDPMADTDTGSPMIWALLGGILVALALMGFFVYRAQSNLDATEARTVVDDLCLAAEQAATDPDAALATFNGTPHNALHSIDIDLRRVDPIAASRVATAKADAEAAMIEGAPDAAQLTRALAEETAAAYRILEDDDTIDGCN